MNYDQMLAGFKSAGHDVSGYAPPPRKKSPSVAAITIEQLAVAIDEAIARFVEPLEARIRELEARPTMRYCGVWDAAAEYDAGDFCTFDGSVWACHKATKGIKPGDARDWQLAVKKGRDARSAGSAQPRPPGSSADPRLPGSSALPR